MRNWIKLKELNWRERKLLIQALVLLPIINILLKSMGYARLVQTIEKRIPISEKAKPASSRKHLNDAQGVARIVSIAANHGLYQATCLRRSLVLIILLRQQGIESELCFGARLLDQGLEAHAWVEIGGVVINDNPDIRLQYTPLDNGLPSTQVGL